MKMIRQSILFIVVIMLVGVVQGCGHSDLGVNDPPSQMLSDGDNVNMNLEIPRANSIITDDVAAFVHAYAQFIDEKYPLPDIGGDGQHPPNEAEIAKYNTVLRKRITENKMVWDYYGVNNEMMDAHLGRITATQDRISQFVGKVAKYQEGLSSGKMKLVVTEQK